MSEAETIDMQSVVLTPREEGGTNNELAEKIHFQCSFCGKQVGIYPMERALCEKLSGEKFYCTFCLRNNHHTKINKHILILSFRSVISYYYHAKYLTASNRKLWISEIADYIDSHWDAGLLNPAFLYDPSSFLWFIDFSKVGKDGRRMRLCEVLKTVANMLACFNLRQHIPEIKMGKYFYKFDEAITKFYKNRYRPADKRMLIPTLNNCGVFEPTTKSFTFDGSRGFTPNNLYGD